MRAQEPSAARNPATGRERSRNSRAPRQGQFRIGEIVPGTRYRVLGLVGAGGMGSVYEVEHLELGKRFVLKALFRELSGRADLVQRLRNEQRALGRLEHPNIVAVTDAGVTDDDIPYFVMERLEGETLASRLKRLGRLSVVEVLAIAAGVLDGLAAAHEIGVVHRDIKPHNILLAAGNRPKILDFGVAKIEAWGNAITGRGVAVGTPRYMSPEQASGSVVDGRSDLYAVGLVLFEAISGAGPFDDERRANALLLAHLTREAPKLARLVPGVTGELDELVAALLAKDPSSRPPNARAAAAALQAVARRYDGAELEAKTPAAGYVVTTRLFCIPASASESGEAETLARSSRAPSAADDTWIDERTSATTPRATPAPIVTERLVQRAAAGEPALESTRTRVPIPALKRAPSSEPARAPGRFHLRELSRALLITLAGAGLGVAVLSLLVALWSH